MCAFFNLKDNTLHIMETPVLEQTLNKCLSLPSETSSYSDSKNISLGMLRHLIIPAFPWVAAVRPSVMSFPLATESIFVSGSAASVKVAGHL